MRVCVPEGVLEGSDRGSMDRSCVARVADLMSEGMVQPKRKKAERCDGGSGP